MGKRRSERFRGGSGCWEPSRCISGELSPTAVKVLCENCFKVQ